MATSGSGTLNAWNGTYTIIITYNWTRDANGVVSWTADIPTIDGTNSPCWTSFFIRGGNNSQGNLTGDLVSNCPSCAQCASYYQGNILWPQTQSGTINMGTGGGTLKLGYYGQRNGTNTSEDYLTWTVDPVATAPTGLNVTGLNVGGATIKGTVSVTGWGGAGDASTRYRELQVWAGNMSGDRRYQPVYGNTMSGEITCNNNSYGSLTITPNTKYWIGGYASNGTLNTGSVNFGTAITQVPVAGGSLASATPHSLTLNWTIANQGGERDIKIDYRLDNGNWTEVTTVSGSGAKNGQFTLSGLLPNSQHTVEIRSSGVGGSVAGGTTLTVSTTDTPEKLYGSVNNTRKRGVRAYCSVNNTRKKVKKIYGSVNGARKLVYEDPNLI